LGSNASRVAFLALDANHLEEGVEKITPCFLFVAAKNGYMQRGLSEEIRVQEHEEE
jgi:hypothetical protein